MQNKQNLFIVFKTKKSQQVPKISVNQNQSLEYVKQYLDKQLPQPQIVIHYSHHYDTKYFSSIPIIKKSLSIQSECFNKCNKQQVFSKVYNYLNYMIENKNILKKNIAEMQFDQSQKNLVWINKSQKEIKSYNQVQSRSLLGNSSLAKSISIDPDNNLSRKYSNFKSNDLQLNNTEQINSNSIIVSQQLCDGSSYNRKHILSKKNQSLINRVSIVVDQQSSSSTIRQSLLNPSLALCSQIASSSLLSVKSQNLTIDDVINQINNIKFNLEYLKEVFSQPEPFLINLALCLLFKYCFYSKADLSEKNLVLLLPISTLVAYKIYEDLPFTGLVQNYEELIHISKDSLICAERDFLNRIQYEAVISNFQYFKMLSYVIDHQKKQKVCCD